MVMLLCCPSLQLNQNEKRANMLGENNYGVVTKNEHQIDLFTQAIASRTKSNI